jgi:cobalt/nickel transport protein
LTKADKNGVFHFGLPKTGWWGFSAIMDSDQPMKEDGEDKKVETAAVIWVYAHSME